MATDSALKQAFTMGEKAAHATHKAHDAATARNTREYFSRWLYSQPEADRKELTEAFNASYRTEASYYIGTGVQS